MIAVRAAFDIDRGRRPNALYPYGPTKPMPASRPAARPAPRLFVDRALAAHSDLTLGREASRYAGRVLRCRPGDSLTLFDGSGAEYAATVTRVAKDGVAVTLGSALERSVESPLAVTLIQGMSRGDRMDTVIQKATELGVRNIVPVESEFSVVRLDAARAASRLEHWQKVAASACEQCGRNRTPRISLPRHLPELLSDPPDAGALRLLLAPDAADGMATAADAVTALELLVGPEGGFSDAERELAVAQGFRPVRLGPRILRTETAAIAALALAQARWGDLG